MGKVTIIIKTEDTSTTELERIVKQQWWPADIEQEISKSAKVDMFVVPSDED